MFAVNDYPSNSTYSQLIMNASSFIVKEFIAIIQTTEDAEKKQSGSFIYMINFKVCTVRNT